MVDGNERSNMGTTTMQRMTIITEKMTSNNKLLSLVSSVFPFLGLVSIIDQYECNALLTYSLQLTDRLFYVHTSNPAFLLAH